MRFTKYTQLTDIDTDLGEKWPMNDCFWTPNADPKFLWGQIVLSSSGASLIRGNGLDNTITREATGIFTLNYSSTFDSQPATIAMPVDPSSSIDDRRKIFASVNDAGNSRYRSTTQQTFVVVDKDNAVIDDSTTHTIFVLILGIDAATTNITNNSSSCPQTPGDMNRFICVGNYSNPSVFTDTCFIYGAGYTSTTGDAGDTMNDVFQLGGTHTRNAAGDYDTVFDNIYLANAHAWVTGLGTDVGGVAYGYGISYCDTQKVYVNMTNGLTGAAADFNYNVIVIGNAKVA